MQTHDTMVERSNYGGSALMDKEKINKSTSILIIIFVVVNAWLRYTGHIESKTLTLILASSVYFTRSIPNFDYKTIKTYLFPITMIIIYIVYAVVY